MGKDSDAPAPEDQDPAPLDSPEPPDQSDSGTNSPPPQPTAQDSSADARVKAAQTALHFKALEYVRLQEENDALKARLATSVGDDEDEISPRERDLQRRLRAYEEEKLAAIYGTDAIEALEAARKVATRDPSPTGQMASYMAFAEAMGRGTPPPASTPEAPTRAEAVVPRVEPNRSDAADLTSLDADIEEAKRKGDLAGFLKAQVARVYGG